MAEGQVVQGVVIDDSTEVSVPAVEVVLELLTGQAVSRTVTDSAGRFVLKGEWAGRYSLRAERIGYSATTTGAFDLALSDTTEVELRLGVHAVPLAPLTVTVAPTVAVTDSRLESWGFYDRRDQYGLQRGSGKAHFLDVYAIRKQNAMRVSDLLRDLHGVRVIHVGYGQSTVQGTRGCRMSVFLDGVRVRGGVDGMVNVSSLAAVEVYAGFPYPAQYAPIPPACGSIVVWTGIVAGSSGTN
jgi:hypothetical protein